MHSEECLELPTSFQRQRAHGVAVEAGILRAYLARVVAVGSESLQAWQKAAGQHAHLLRMGLSYAETARAADEAAAAQGLAGLIAAANSADYCAEAIEQVESLKI